MTVITVFALAFIFVAQKEAIGDQHDVCDVAYAFRMNDLSIFESGAYANEHPHQFGIEIFIYCLSFLVGNYNYLAFQVLNIAALLMIYLVFEFFAEYYGASNITKLAVICFFVVFIPGLMYTTFVYGTLIGLCFSLYATKNILLFQKTLKYIYVLWTVICSVFAVSLKSNYMIFLIANVFLCILILLKNRKFRFGVLAILLLLVLFFNKKLLYSITQGITGVEPGPGSSNLSYVAMGLQENEGLFDGWWNFYNTRSYMDADYDSVKQTELVKEYISGRIKEFQGNPRMALKFFSGKNASQWNNPDFEGFWVNSVMPERWGYTELKEKIYADKILCALFEVLNYYQFIILMGVLMYVLLSDKKEIFLLFAMVFIGGFLFHTFWEAKAQYTLPYFMLLLPLSCIGYRNLITEMIVKNSKLQTKRLQLSVVIFLLFIAIIKFGDFSLLSDIFCQVRW